MNATKPVFWVGSSKKDLAEFPPLVRRMMGYALYIAQFGKKDLDAKPLKGFGSKIAWRMVKPMKKGKI